MEAEVTILEISRLPESIPAERMREFLAERCSGVHQSVLRGYHVAAKVRELLEANTPPAVVLQIMDVMEDRDA